jgi:putative addiction module component (TIGR02574 family)
MTNSPDSFDFSELTPAECILLAEELWEKARNHPEAVPVTPAQLAELNATLDALEAGQLGTPQPWDEVKLWLESK